MSRARLYLDEDASDSRLLNALRLRGIDVETADEAGLRQRADAIHLTHAATQGRVLYSFNRGDFLRLHEEYMLAERHHAGLILTLQQRYSVGEQMRRLLRIVREKSAEDMRDNVEFLSAWH